MSHKRSVCFQCFRINALRFTCSNTTELKRTPYASPERSLAACKRARMEHLFKYVSRCSKAPCCTRCQPLCGIFEPDQTLASRIEEQSTLRRVVLVEDACRYLGSFAMSIDGVSPYLFRQTTPTQRRRSFSSSTRFLYTRPSQPFLAPARCKAIDCGAASVPSALHQAPYAKTQQPPLCAGVASCGLARAAQARRRSDGGGKGAAECARYANGSTMRAVTRR